MFVPGVCIKSEKFSWKCWNPLVLSTRVNKNSTTFDFQLIFVQEETFKETNTRTWIGKHVQISLSSSSNFVRETILFCNSYYHHPIESFSGAHDNSASHSTVKVENLFVGFETTTRIKTGNNLENLTKCHNRWSKLEPFTRIKMTVKTNFVPLISSYTSKRISYLDNRSIWNDNARYYVSLVLTAQNLISI